MGLRIALTGVHSWPAVQRGAERYLHELAAALLTAGHDVRVLSTGAPSREEVLGVPVRRLPVRGKGLAVERQFGKQSLRALALPRMDVWHATSTGDGAAAARLGRFRPRLRTVFTDHGFPVRASRERRGDAGLHQQVVDGIGTYVCVSEAAGAWLTNDFGRAPSVVPPGVDTAAFSPGGTRSARPTVLYSGALDEQRKGVRLLVAAVALVPDAQLVLAGPGTPDLTGLPTDHVVMRGLVPRAELVDAYRSAWVTALPSTEEAFGLALTESLACGTPGVARVDGGGPAEILLPGTGELCEGTAEALAEALQKAMATSDPVACRARAEEFDWRTRVVPMLEQVYAA
ncbi:MAG: glycosyltransferase family 1 protein [Frankiales bacterium]|nr:glycosyltransferase family 1 protein [Frankiales bacterium]